MMRREEATAERNQSGHCFRRGQSVKQLLLPQGSCLCPQLAERASPLKGEKDAVGADCGEVGVKQQLLVK